MRVTSNSVLSFVFCLLTVDRMQQMFKIFINYITFNYRTKLLVKDKTNYINIRNVILERKILNDKSVTPEARTDVEHLYLDPNLSNAFFHFELIAK